MAPLRYALNQGKPAKAGSSIFFHCRYTLAVLLSTAQASLHSRPAAAVQLPQHRHVAPHKKKIPQATFSFCCGAWGCLIAPQHSMTPNENQPTKKKIKEKEGKLRFHNECFEPFGF
ncbi:MAG: hypothetical protein H7339_17230 [Arcicella sp.]|nr:hypothetical protein [Arcicella sp.]